MNGRNVRLRSKLNRLWKAQKKPMLNLGFEKVFGIAGDLIPDGLSHAATQFVESLKINSITERKRHGRQVVVKRRNTYGQRAADLINFYFRLANIPIRFVSDVREWRHWEARCFQRL